MSINFEGTKEKLKLVVQKQKKLVVFTLSIAFLVILGLFFVIPKIQTNIRTAEINALVNQTFPSKKINFLDFKTSDKLIQEKNAITVLFAVPSGYAYEKVIKVLQDEDSVKDFNHSVNIYPMVYNVKEIEEKYQVNQSDVTAVFFEEGKEKNRFIIDGRDELQTILIPALNQLPLASND